MNKDNQRTSCVGNKSAVKRENYRILYHNFNLDNDYLKDFRTSISTNINVWGIYYGVIYRLTDTINCKVYIGQTIQVLKDRFRQHFKAPPNKYLAQVFSRYKKKFKIIENGIINNTMSYRSKGGEFTIEVIEYCTDVFSINKAEIRYIENHKSWIKKYGTKYGYNLNRGGGD